MKHRILSEVLSYSFEYIQYSGNAIVTVSVSDIIDSHIAVGQYVVGTGDFSLCADK